MKTKEITFKQSVKIFQVYRNINVYGKRKKSFGDRREVNEWKEIMSKAGCVVDNELFLPEQILNNPDLKNCDLIIIEDDNKPVTFTANDLRFAKLFGTKYEPDYNQCFRTTQPNRYHIFEIRKNENIELHLRYGYFEVGIPERGNFKLCDIKKNEPIEIKINGKTDFSSSSRRDRVFKEQDYVVEYIGDFKKCKILREPYDPILKKVPSNRKVVDLTKQLW